MRRFAEHGRLIPRYATSSGLSENSWDFNDPGAMHGFGPLELTEELRESIVAESDVRAFLAPGVPPELTRAALRRTWSADPKIRDFIGLSENSWDFNDLDAWLWAAGADGRDPPGNSAHDRPQPWGESTGCPPAMAAPCRSKAQPHSFELLTPTSMVTRSASATGRSCCRVGVSNGISRVCEYTDTR